MRASKFPYRYKQAYQKLTCSKIYILITAGGTHRWHANTAEIRFLAPVNSNSMMIPSRVEPACSISLFWVDYQHLHACHITKALGYNKRHVPVLENITKLQFIALNRNVHTIGSKSSENLA